MEENNNNSPSSTKEELLSDYTFKSDTISPVSKETMLTESPWYNTYDGMQNTYLSENLSLSSFQDKIKEQAKMQALRKFFENEAVSMVDLPTLTIQDKMDDKGEL